MSKRANVEFSPSPQNGQPYHTLVLPAVLAGTQDPMTSQWIPSIAQTQGVIEQVKAQTYVGYLENVFFCNLQINVDWKKRKLFVTAAHAAPEDSIFTSFIQVN